MTEPAQPDQRPPQTPAPEASQAAVDPVASAPAATSPPPRRARSRRPAILLFLILLPIGGAALGWLALERWAARPFGEPGPHPLAIRPGAGTRATAALLKNEGLVSDDRLLLLWLALHGRQRGLQAGEYELRTPLSPEQLAAALAHGRFERTLVIPEGWTARQIARRLAAEKIIKSESEWLDLVARPLGPEPLGEPLPGGAEGYCFPDTYRFDMRARAEEILRRMLAKFRREWVAARPAERAERSRGLTLQQVVILASMVEREARTPREMPRIAAVYLNRLHKGMKMQCCATVRYALGEVWDRPLTYGDLKLPSPYNTYLHPGLPPGPIANPGRPALEAVLRPAPSDDLFYVYAGNKHHVFSRTYAEHLKAVRAAREHNPQGAEPGQDTE